VYLDGNSIGGVSAGYATEPQTFTYTTTAALDSLPLHVDFSSWYYYLISFKVNGNTITPTRTGSEPNYDFDYTFASEFEDATGVQGDICQREDYTYGASADDHNAGRLLSVKYRGGYNSGASPTCDTVFTETYAYSAPGAVTGKTMTVKRGSLNALDLTSTYTYDNEGRNTVVQYPPTWNGSSYANGPNRTIVYDSMGRLEKLVNTSGSPTDIISATTYSPMGQLLTMTGTSGGASSESRQYNSIGQMKRLTLTASGTAVLDMAYKFPTSGTTNDGKILSQVNELPTSASDKEEVEYQYDKLSRLALAETKTGTTSTQWGQSYAYDGFGNLTTVSTTKGSTYTLSTTYDYATNRRTSGDCADANGNLQEAAACTNGVYYDIANRVIRNEGTIAYAYSYAPGDNRVWRGVWDTSYPNAQNTDELTYYSADGAKLVAYNLTVSGSNLRASASGEYYEYFGGKLLKNSQGWVNQDRLGSIGKFFPYGQERPSATSDGTEKFATYFRDSETGLDYAQRRYHDPGDGRFLTTDPLDASAKVGDPGSWNRYTYVEGDPVNRFDPTGQFYVYPGIPDQMWCTSLLGGNLPLDCVGDWSPACLMNPWACIQGVLSGPSCSVGANGFFSAGGGNNPTNCEIPYYPPASAATPPLNCGESLAAQGLLPSSATEVALASVLLGENSWGLIGSKQYRAGDKAGRPSGSTITADTVGEENNLMLDVIANAAKARKKSLLEEASNSRRYAGYTNGSKRFVKYQQSSVGSSECNDLTQVDKAVIAFMAGGAKPRTAYNQWRAVRQGNRIVIHAGGRTAGGTDFYTISNP
jgi:RHS repeat-associated protein